MEEQQVKVTITVDKYYTADALRELANLIEEREVEENQEMCDYDFETETYHYVAKIEEI